MVVNLFPKMAKVMCLECGYPYEEEVGPTQCPMCESVYVTWLDYKGK